MRKLTIIIGLAAYIVAGVAATWAARRAGVALPSVARIALLAQCLVVAFAAPFFAASIEKPAIFSVLGALMKTAIMIAAGLIIAFLGVLMSGTGLPAEWLLASAGILLGFAAVLIGAVLLARTLLQSTSAAQVAGYVLAILMLSTVFYANPAIANTRGASKIWAIQAVVIANPMVTMSGAAVEYDMLIGRRSDTSLYHISLIGPDHLYRYPRWWAASLIYFFSGCVFSGVAVILSRPRDGYSLVCS